MKRVLLGTVGAALVLSGPAAHASGQRHAGRLGAEAVAAERYCVTFGETRIVCTP